jgi:glycosyltransferase involved in cell wall biosynthesis
MKISLILCTYNRSQSLRRALESIAASKVADSTEWEVLVVDNNSRDETRLVVESFLVRFPGLFRYYFEQRQGKSFALNTGILESVGEILAFTDDDVIVEPTWLQNLTAPLESGEWSGASGRILPMNDFSCPPWLALQGEYNLGGVITIIDHGDTAGETIEPPVGASMAFRREMFEKYGFFRTDLGPSPGSEIRNEDIEFGARLLAGGEHIWYESSAVLYHEVPESRLTKNYFLQYWHGYGRARIRESANRSDVWGMPRWLFSVPMIVFNVLPARLRIWLFARDEKRRFFFKCTVWRTFGEIVELPRIWLERKRPAKSAASKN